MAPSVTTILKRSLAAVSITAFLVLPCLSLAAVNFTYDVNHRLTGAAYDNGVTVSYSYDSLGNRLTKVATGIPYTVYEDGEDSTINGWDIYDADPTGAEIANIYDDIRQSRVIEFTGTATANGYRLRNNDLSYWNDDKTVLEWSMRYLKSYIVYIAVQTRDGFRYIYYTAAETDNLGTGTYIHHGLGSTTRDGNWHTFVRDLEYDLKEAQPDNELEAVLGFLIRGSGRVDDIKTLNGVPASLDSDGDTITDLDEINIYGTHPYHSDSDGDGISDGAELVYWGASWNSDPDNDGLINLLDQDSDGDGIFDGVEVSQGTDPADPASYPATIVYEDAEDGNTEGWDTYDSDPTGAIIDNVYDGDRDSRVIEFTGSATSNGYRLRDDNGSYWDDTNFKVMEWSMRYDENFIIYIAVQTSDGFRYIYYTAAESDNLGTGTYIHHGLGSQIKDGSWQTVIRDLEYDLKEAQPDNELEAVLGFLIRGSGRIDDIQTREAIPLELDSDGDGLTDLDEINIYTTHPYYGDSDGDNLHDGEEIAFWGTSWNSDPDGDGLVNILDPDSDDDGIADGIEVQQGTNPADAASYPTSIVYEDSEDGDTSGWDIYDDAPAGSTVTNIYDDDRGSRVIELNGAATANGYRLRNDSGSYWDDTNFKVMEWSMRYNENFIVYIAAQTSDGFRYIYYTSSASDNLGTGTYIHHGLGSEIKDGNWHTVVRDLESDLQDAQPGNQLEAVLGFLIRGSGMVDDIMTHETNPAGP